MPGDPDLFFAPLGAEQTMESLAQDAQFDQLISDAMTLANNPLTEVQDIPASYDAKLRALIDAIAME